MVNGKWSMFNGQWSMNYLVWLWHNARGIRWNMAVRIVTGIGHVVLGLQLAKPDATDDELQEVLHTACADFIFDLPNGLDTELGERGSGLSEGQAQRIAIARGLLHGGDIFLFDEISSSLDEQTEQTLYARIFAAYPQKTMLLITHRTAVRELCDEMVRL